MISLITYCSVLIASIWYSSALWVTLFLWCEHHKPQNRACRFMLRPFREQQLNVMKCYDQVKKKW